MEVPSRVMWSAAVSRARSMRAACLWAVAGALGAVAGALLPLEAERLRASVGGYAVMNCHLDFPFGNEIPYHLHWDKDGESILSWYSGGGGGVAPVVGDRWGGRVRRLEDGRLGLGRGSINVSAVRETDSGLYRCRVTFPNRTPPARNNGTFYYLEVDGGNLIATPPVNVTVLEGERAELECSPKARDAQVEWYREGEPVSALPELAARASRLANGSLVIERAASTDPGEYSCRVADATGDTQSAAAYLDVHYPAKVVYAPSDRYLPLGKPASLDCHFSANPPLTNLRWEKDGFLFDPYNVPGVFYSRNGSLLFNQVDESHEGQYSCTPYNALGTSGASPRVHVHVLRPPALAVRPLPLYVARLGGSLTLPCALADDGSGGGGGGPRPRLRWTREHGAPLPAGRHSVVGGNLTLMEVAPEDAGGYECRVEDDAAGAGAGVGVGVAARTDLLVENAPPRAPDALRASPTATGVHLLWRPGEGGTSVEYTVWYRERAASEWRTMKILSRGVTEATVTGLRPGTDYELRVLAQDLIGDGLFSKPLFVRTLEAEAEAEPPEEGALGVTDRDRDLEQEAAEGSDELEVTVRLLEEGALVRWERGAAGAGAGTCTVRWYEGARLAATASTRQDYLLVREVAEGGRYAARVACGAAAGSAALAVPEYSRLRAAAAAVAGAALLLAAAGAALYLLAERRRRAARRRTSADKRPR